MKRFIAAAAALITLLFSPMALAQTSGFTVSGVPDPLLLSSGALATPTYSFAADPTTGMWFRGAGFLSFSVSGVQTAEMVSNGFKLRSNGYLGWSSTTTASGSADTFLWRDGAAGILAMRSGTGANAQALNAYNYYDDSSNYERGSLTWKDNTNVFEVGTFNAGIGSARQLAFVTNNIRRWYVNTNGDFLAQGDNAYDIGASGASRPRTIYAGTNVLAAGSMRVGAGSSYLWDTRGYIAQTSDGVFTLNNNAGTNTVSLTVGAGGTLTTSAAITSGGSVNASINANLAWVTRSRMNSSADGLIAMQNAGGTDFTRLILGANDTSGIALRKTGTRLDVVNGDGTAYAAAQALSVTATTFVKTTATTVANLTPAATAGAGGRAFVTDALGPVFGAAVVGGGAVSMPVYSDGAAWLVGDSGQDQLFDIMAANDNAADLYSLAA